MVALTQLVLFATGTLALVLPRDGAQILSSLKDIKSAYDNLTVADNNFASGADSNPLSVQNAVDQVEVANIIAISASALTTPLTEADVTAIVNYVNSSLEPAILAEIKAAESAKKTTDQQGISLAVAIEMQELKSFSDLIGKNLVAKAPSKTAASKINKAFGKIDTDYNQGISFFSS